jgi:hypothetical protein
MPKKKPTRRVVGKKAPKKSKKPAKKAAPKKKVAAKKPVKKKIMPKKTTNKKAAKPAAKKVTPKKTVKAPASKPIAVKPATPAKATGKKGGHDPKSLVSIKQQRALIKTKEKRFTRSLPVILVRSFLHWCCSRFSFRSALLWWGRSQSLPLCFLISCP